MLMSHKYLICRIEKKPTDISKKFYFNCLFRKTLLNQIFGYYFFFEMESLNKHDEIFDLILKEQN